MEIVWTAIVAFVIAIFGGGDGSNNQNNRSSNQEKNPPIEQPSPKPGTAVGNNPGGQATSVPTPALLPGLIGLGVAALRKHKSAKDETSV